MTPALKLCLPIQKHSSTDTQPYSVSAGHNKAWPDQQGQRFGPLSPLCQGPGILIETLASLVSCQGRDAQLQESGSHTLKFLTGAETWGHDEAAEMRT